jgi:hypothetical protein
MQSMRVKATMVKQLKQVEDIVDLCCRIAGDEEFREDPHVLLVN